MKHLILLIIYIIFLNTIQSQRFEVTIEFKSNAKSAIDSTKTILSKKTKVSKNHISDSIINQLHTRGYLQALSRNINKDKNTNNSTYQIILNRKYTHIKIKEAIENKKKSLKNIQLSRKREQIISLNSQEEYLKNRNQELKENGFPFNEAHFSNITFTQNDTIDVNLQITQSEKRYLDNLVIKGYNKFPVKTISNHFNKKNIYNEESIIKINNTIAAIPFVKKTKSTDVLFKQDSTKIFLYLEKVKTNTADGLLGFNNSQEGKIELNGYINLKLQNNLNRAETLLIEYRNDNGDQTKLLSSLDLPYLWNTPVGIKTQIDIQRRDSTYQRTSFTTGVSYKPSWQTNINLNYKSTNSNATEENLNTQDFTTKGIELSSTYKSLNSDLLMPENLTLTASLGSHNRDGENKNEKQFTFNATFLKLWHLNYRSKFLSKLTSYYLKSENIQFNELYQLGGLGSIRGFKQNSIDSSFYTTLATEYRYRLNDQIYLHSILDIGVFENFNSKKLDKLYGFGAGIAILTKAGILNLSIANGSFNNAKVELSSTIAHISLKINF